MRTAVLLLVLLVVQGCAFTGVHLPLALPEDSTLAGPLSGVEQKNFTVVRIEDVRDDKARIGHVRNGFGMITADFLSEEPVESVVRRAVEATLAENGHVVGDSGIRVTGEISVFWVETDVNARDIELMGQIACELVFFNESEELYRNDFVGSHSVRVHVGRFSRYRLAMNGALASLAEAISHDEGLAEALRY